MLGFFFSCVCILEFYYYDALVVMICQVRSPHNLELDSDTSSVAAWSFSMATPTTASAEGGADEAGGAGSCSHVDLSLVSVATTTTTADDDSLTLASEDEEGISSADESILKQKSDHYKTLLKIKDKVLLKNKVSNIHYDEVHTYTYKV